MREAAKARSAARGSVSLLASPLVIPGAPGEAEQAKGELEDKLKNAEEIKLREESRTKFASLNSEQAMKVDGEAASAVIDEPDGGPPRLPQGQSITGYLNADVGQVDLGGGEYGLVQMLAPMAVPNSSGGWSPINLGLSEAGDAFVPANPLVAVRIPKRLGEGVQAPASGLSVVPVGSNGASLAGSEGAIDGATVFYANTLTDSDTIVKPSTWGFAVDTTLRSVRSPQQLSFRVGMPEGASLVQAKDGPGAVEVVKEGVAIAVVPAPAARDAAGTVVPVSMSASGNTLTLSVDDSSGEFLWPISVDPEFNTTTESLMTGNWRYSGGAGYAFSGEYDALDTSHSGSFASGDQADWMMQTQGVSKIYEFSVDDTLRPYFSSSENEYKQGTLPFMAAWVELARAGVESHELKLSGKVYLSEGTLCSNSGCTPEGVAEHNAAYFDLNTTEPSGSEPLAFSGYVNNATTYIAEPKETHSTVSFNTSSSELEYAPGKKTPNVLEDGGWIGPDSGAFAFTASDAGLGIAETKFEYYYEGAWRELGGEHPPGVDNYLDTTNCTGIQCLASESEVLTYTSLERDMGAFHLSNGGEKKIRVAADDAIEHTWSSEHGEGEVTLKIDNLPPRRLKLSGLPEGHDGVHELGEVEAHVKAEAADEGEGGTASSGMKSLELLADGRVIGKAEGSCAQGPCTASAEWSINGAELGVGLHVLTVRATDNVGNIATESYKLEVHAASPVAMSPGSVNPESGDFALGATDVEVSGGEGALSVTRHYDSRNPKEGEYGPLGPQWSISLGSQASLEVLPEGGVMVVGPEGLAFFSPKTGGGFEAPKGDTDLTLEYKAEYEGKEPAYLLKNAAKGVSTVFRLPKGAKSWMPTISKGPTATNTTTDEYTSIELEEENKETKEEEKKTIVEPTLELAPHPSASCGVEELEKLEIAAKGCRALKFVYGSKTKEHIGENESEWGEYKNRLMEVIAIAYNPATKAMEKKAVAAYEYDSLGRLRAEWNPQISPALKTTYGYDAEGHVTALTPPGKETWVFTYGTLASDANTGRLLKVMQAPASAGLWNGSRPVEYGFPEINDEPVVGQAVGVSNNGLWLNSPVAFSYQWEDCNSHGQECVPIPGANGRDYTPTVNDAEHTLVAKVTATNGGGSATAESVLFQDCLEDRYPVVHLVENYYKTGETRDIVAGPDKNLWFTETTANKIGRITTSGTVTEYALPSGSEPRTIVAGPGGESALWFTERGTSKIGKITTSGTVSEYALPSGSKPDGIAPGPDGENALWFTEEGTSKIGKITTSGSVGEYALASGENSPVGITPGPGSEKALWFTYRWKQIGKITSEGSVSNYTLPVEEEIYPADEITAGPDGNLWFRGGGGVDLIYKLTTSGVRTEYPGTSGAALDVGPEGDIWFSGAGIERMTTSGERHEFLSNPFEERPEMSSMAVGSDGNIWFTARRGGSISKINVDTPSQAEPEPPQPGTTIEYNVPVSGTGAPQQMSEGEVAKWGQKDAPAYAAAIIPPSESEGWPAKSYKQATVLYLDNQARTVNVANPSGGISTTEYNEENQVTRSLSTDNRATAMNEGCISVAKKECKSSEVAELLDTKSSYNKEGQLAESWGPQHTVRLAVGEEKPDEETLARNHVRYFYDEGAPEGETYGLVTKIIDGAETPSKEEFDKRTATTSYSGQSNLGWKLRMPTSTTTNPGGLNLTSTTKYEESTGNVIETQAPAAAGKDADVPPAYAAQFGKQGTEAGQLKEPRAAVVASNGDVYVLDTANDRIEEYSSTGSFIQMFGWGVSDGKSELEVCKTSCKAGLSGSGNGQLKAPRGIGLDSKGDIWVADTGNDRIQELGSKGEYLAQYGKEGTAEDQFKEPTGIEITATGNVFVTDTGNERVQELSEKGVFVDAFGFGVSNGKSEAETCKTGCKTGLAGTGEGQFSTPRGLVATSSGDIWVADEGNDRIEEFRETGEYLAKSGAAGTGNGQYEEPQGVAVEPSGGNLWVADNTGRVQELSSTATYIATIGTKGSGNGQFEEPAAPAITTAGILYIPDTKNNRVQRWVPTITGNQGAHDIKTIYYTAGSEAEASACRNHIEWAGLPCQTEPAAQPGVSGLPELPVVKISYNMWDQPETTEETYGTGSEAKTRTRKTTYEPSGRPTGSEVTATIDKELPKVSDKYNTTTGALEEQSTTTSAGTETITSKYNRRGQLESYTDSSGNTATFEYEKEGDERLVKMTDAKGSQTYHYNETTGALGELTDSATGTFTASYDVAGKMIGETDPNGMTAYYTHDSAGETTGIEYVKTAHCAKTCPEVWYSDKTVPSIHGETLKQTSTLSEELSYTYDAAGRLLQTQEIPTGEGCKTRTYSYDEDSNRTVETTREPGSKGECATEGGNGEWHTYDTANTLSDPGVTYETFGNTTKLPASDAGGSELTSEYYVDGQVLKQEQGEQKIEYKPDPKERTRETISTGKPVDSTVISHYDASGGAVAWTGEGSGEKEKWTRNIPGMGGALTATQKGEGKTGGAVVLLLHDLKGDVVAEAALSETETKLLKSYNSTEFGVPNGKEAPPKYAWLGAAGVAGELPSGVITQDGVTYVPQTGRPLQTEGVPLPAPENAAKPFVSTLEPWVAEVAATAGAHQVALAEEERKKTEEANKPPGAIPVPESGEESGGGVEEGGGGGGGARAASNHDLCKMIMRFGEPFGNELWAVANYKCTKTVAGFEVQVCIYEESKRGTREVECNDSVGKKGRGQAWTDTKEDAGSLYKVFCITGVNYRAWSWGRVYGMGALNEVIYPGWTPQWHCTGEGSSETWENFFTYSTDGSWELSGG